MDDFLKTAELAYKKACLRFIQEYAMFNQNNVSLSQEGIFTVNVQPGIEPFISLGEIIYWGIALFDRIDATVLPKEKKLISGFRHVYNITKHKKSPFSVADILQTVPRFSGKGVPSPQGGHISCTVSVAFFFKDISMIPIDDDQERTQRNNYNSYTMSAT